MTSAVPDILARIVDHKRVELADIRHRLPELERTAVDRSCDRRNFAAALRRPGPSIIAEVKKASPSKGVLVESFDPAAIATAYQSGGAAALSVLTDVRFFQGGLADLEAARSAVAIPALRKDFTLEPFHVIEAAAHGADAILLIAAVLSEREMRELRELAARFGLAALVEVHNSSELETALASGADIIGVNNRNLHTFEVRLETSLDLIERIPSNLVRVTESGISTNADVQKLSAAGYDAFLVGEHLMRNGDPQRALRELLG